MEIDVTEIIENFSDYYECSGSVAEFGNGAAIFTWNNSLRMSQGKTYAPIEKLIEHFRDYGAWTLEELKSWPNEDLQALFLQDVVSTFKDNPELQEGRIFLGDDNKYYFYIGL